MHKLVYFPANNDGMFSCTGCGRCVEKCPQSLNIVKVIKAFAAQGIPFWVESFTNQQFVILTDAQKETLEKRYIFEPMGKSADGGNIARFCTSWATTEEEVQTLIDDLKAL